MKILAILSYGLIMASPLFAQGIEAVDSTGLPGDNFSLQGALELFKNSVDLEQFETKLNTESNNVNNLDLNADGQIDYVRVESVKDGDAVAITLRVPVSRLESQDVAVIELEKTGAESAVLQIRGDEDLYPAETIVEPFAETEAPTKSNGPSASEPVRVQVVVNVWAWNCPRWCFSARFVPWVSPWYWGYYPGYWKPWRPHPWRAWYGWGYHYHAWYRPWNSCRVVHAHALYAPRRMRSATVQVRYKDAHVKHGATQPTAKPPNTAPRSKSQHGKKQKGGQKGAPKKGH